MTVYLVWVNIEYEGAFMPSLRVFTDKDKATEYCAELKKQHPRHGDRVYLEERTINQ